MYFLFGYGNNSIQIAALLIPSIIKFIMEAHFNVDSLFTFLQKACASTKAMQAASLPEIAQVSANLPLLNKINDKGLLILMLAKIISEKLAALPRSLTLLLVEMFPVERQPRVRRPQDENGERRRRRRRRGNPQDLDIQELSNQSIVNPVNVLPPAVGEIRGRMDNQDQNSKGSKANSSDNGKQQPPIDNNFPQVFSQLERQLGVDQEINIDHGDSSQTNSQTNSSNNSNRFGAIPNFNKKLDILGTSVVLPQRTVRRPRAPAAQGRPTRRKGESVRDVKIDLDDTAATFRNESLDLTVEAIRSRHGQLEEHAEQYYFDKEAGTIADRIRNNIFSVANQEKLLRFNKKARAEVRPREEPDMTHEITDFTDPLTASFVPQSTLFQQPDSLYRQHLDSNIFRGAERLTLSELRQRVKKPRWEIFQNLLWLAPQGQLELQQDDPQHFGEIVAIRPSEVS